MNPDVGHYAFSLLAIFLVYIFVSSAIEGFKKKFHWRWGVILLLAVWTFIEFGTRTNTFDFMWRKTKEFFQNPPWKSQSSEITKANYMVISQELQEFN